MAFDLTGKTALITAAGQGIGFASAVALAEAGAKVFATDINETTFAALEKAHSGIEPFRLNVLDDADVQGAAERTGPIDILFNCAGVVHNGTILECPPEDLNFALQLNVMAAYRTIRAYLPGMLDKGGGSIINMSSVASSVKGVPNRFAYSASKAGTIGLTKSVAADYVARGVRCNAICPGTVQSPSLDDRLRAQGDYEAARKAFIARQPIGRIGKPEEIAALVLYLASDEASYTTGQIHVIDGGWTA
ncbi:2-keto-3-deoxy-L-fuconate dehydrogenase [Hyphomicrobiales bacterium]|nr:2-keto-3-deoxy-L-fuconate dehydrogenase [Hyphomicrobiales bacterium]CAH1669181.1 2-keto-3-deoxy-L-fuconate dehydrogenase [Hyphomicrobiales bacterium]